MSASHELLDLYSFIVESIYNLKCHDVSNTGAQNHYDLMKTKFECFEQLQNIQGCGSYQAKHYLKKTFEDRRENR